ncbi:MAG: M28 family peptidase [Bacteroidota bacterium]|jgi:Zn-dependent M28 family amino/carboxypeptidase
MSFIGLALLLFLQQYPPQDLLTFITAENLKRHIAVLADDSLQGRAPSTPGDQKATGYIVSEMKRIGLTPAGENGGYLQTVPIVGSMVDPGTVFRFSNGERSMALAYSTEFVAMPGAHEPLVDVKNIPVVFVGYGIVAPEQRWDDYKDVDVSGKMIVMLNNDPGGDDPGFFGGKGRTYYGRWTYKYEIAAKKGALGAIVVHTTLSAGYPYRVIQNSFSTQTFDLDQGNETGSLRIKAWTTEEATKKYLRLAGYDLDSLCALAEQRSFRPIVLPLQFSTTMRSSVRKLQTNNIIGRLQGSDPSLSDQYIIFSAHYDHFGIGRAVNGDSIYNGALDNASGTSLMLNLAEAFASSKEKPRRSLLFAAVAAEEQGLLGSSYFASHPTVPVQKIIANLNTDVMNVIGRTSDISCQGSDRSSLGNDLATVAGEMDMVVKPDQAPEQGGFYRSDHFSFAKVGIPSMSIGGGGNFLDVDTAFVRKMHEEQGQSYHQPGDELKEYWNYSGGLQQAELIIKLVWRIGNIIEMPYWNKGNEFETVRKSSMRSIESL